MEKKGGYFSPRSSIMSSAVRILAPVPETIRPVNGDLAPLSAIRGRDSDPFTLPTAKVSAFSRKQGLASPGNSVIKQSG